MKYILSGIFLLFAQGKAEEKKYTEVQLREEVAKQLKKWSTHKGAFFTKELLDREKKIQLKELELKKQKEQFQKNQQEFEKKLQAFLKEQSKLIGCLDRSKKDAGKRIHHMVSVISNMRPQAAADVLGIQDMDISVRILGLLDAKKVSRIFNVMDKEKSARLQKQYMTMKK